MSYSLSYSHALLLLVFVFDKVDRGQFDFVPLREIAEQLALPRPTLAKILASLISKSIVESKEGKNGGVRLAKAPKAFTLCDIFAAVEGEKPVFPMVPTIKATGVRPDTVRTAVQALFNKTDQNLKKELAKVSFHDFLKNM